MNGTAFTLNGTPLNRREIDQLDKYDLLRAFFETVNNCQKSGLSSQSAYFFATECVNQAAAAAGKPAPLKIEPKR